MNNTAETRCPAPSTHRDREAHAALERTLERIRAGADLDADTLVALAWDYFLAGFAARDDENRDASADRHLVACPARPARPEATETDVLAEHVAALTPRRLEVLRLVARGLTNREIGQVLGISAYTVKSHLTALFDSLDVTNRTEAAFALQRFDTLYPDADAH